MHPHSKVILPLVIGLIGIAAPATAGQLSYQYDSKGRLVTVSRSGTGGYNARYTYDKADNRLSYTVTGASTPPPKGGVVVVPLNGYKVIPLGT